MIASLDHIVITTADLSSCLFFYSTILGMTETRFGDNRIALSFGTQKINIHLSGKEHQPHAQHPSPGSQDLCFLLSQPLDLVIQHLHKHHIPIVLGPIERTGACSPLRSIYIRDPDLNLIELSEPLQPVSQ